MTEREIERERLLFFFYSLLFSSFFYLLCFLFFSFLFPSGSSVFFFLYVLFSFSPFFLIFFFTLCFPFFLSVFFHLLSSSLIFSSLPFLFSFCFFVSFSSPSYHLVIKGSGRGSYLTFVQSWLKGRVGGWVSM